MNEEGIIGYIAVIFIVIIISLFLTIISEPKEETVKICQVYNEEDLLIEEYIDCNVDVEEGLLIIEYEDTLIYYDRNYTIKESEYKNE